MKAPKIYIFLTMAVLAACSANQGDWDDGVHAVQPPDIPIPLEMKLRDHQHRSHSREDKSYRYADLVYTGTTPVAQAASYMLERMPYHSWRLESQESPKKGTEVLVFRRGRYTTSCTISRREAKTVMEIQLRTKVTIQ